MPSFFWSWSIAASTRSLSPELRTPAWSVTRPGTPKGASARAGPPAETRRAAVRPRTTESRRTLEPPIRVGVLRRTSGLYARAGAFPSPPPIPWVGLRHPTVRAVEETTVPGPDRIPATDLPPGAVRGHGE